MSTNSPGDEPDLSEWISQAEAARLHGVSRQAISKLVRAGKLRSLEVGGRRLVSRADVSGFRPQPAGRPRSSDATRVGRIVALLESSSAEERLEVFRHLRREFRIHPLETTLNTEAEVLLDAIDRAGPLTLRMIRGVVAQAAFDVHVIGDLEGWVSRELEGNRPFDFLLERGNRSVKVQVKLQRRKEGRPMMAVEASKRMFSDEKYVVETQRTRAGVDRRTKGSTRPYRFGEFDVLAVSMHPSSERWDTFMYTVADWLIRDPKESKNIFKFQPISPTPDDDWTDDLPTCLDWLDSGREKIIRP